MCHYRNLDTFDYETYIDTIFDHFDGRSRKLRYTLHEKIATVNAVQLGHPINTFFLIIVSGKETSLSSFPRLFHITKISKQHEYFFLSKLYMY